MNLFRISILIFIGVINFDRCIGQSKVSDLLPHASIEAGAFVSPESDTPFWLRTNQYGIIPGKSPAGMIQANVFRDYRKQDSITKISRNFDWGFVVNPVLTYDKENKSSLLLPEAHFKVRFKAIEFYAGRRREVMGLGDSTLSSGFYAGSGNALPIPKVQLATVGYVPIAFRKFLAINASFGHGWINSPPHIYAANLHQKHVYFRLGKPASATKFYFGLNHQAIWSGHSDYLKLRPDLAENGQLPDSWKLYKYIVLGYTPKNWYEIAGYSAFDSYRVGNHVGSYDFGMETKIQGSKLLVYYQHAYEDVSSLLFKNFPDGLWGANWVPKVGTGKFGHFTLTRLTLEFLTTKDQSGSEFYITGSKYQGADNYFNHTQYEEGYSYRGATIGTPFIAPGKDLDHSKFVSARFFPNNRVDMWYLGAQAKYRRSLLLTVRASYSRNFGILQDPFNPPRGQFSSIAAAQFPFRKWQNTFVNVKLAVDQGDVYTKSYAAYFSIKKNW